MVNNFITILFLLCIQLKAFAYYTDSSLIRFEELYYYSNFEEVSFNSFNNGEKDYLSLLLSIDPGMNQNKYEIILREIQLKKQGLLSKKYLKASSPKKIEAIYKDVQQNILKKYQDKILFSQIFSQGYFNCLTASAYYGILLDSLGIEYEFKESSNHVHPIAYPGSLKIKIETTDPVNGIEYFDEKLKYKFVNYLLSSKVISKDEYHSTPVNDLFYKHYYPDKSTGMEELTGLQYMNDALYRYNAEDYSGAFEQIKKACYLYPSEKMLTIMEFILIGVIGNTSYKRVEDAGYFIYMSRLDPSKFLMEVANFEFLNLTQKVLVDNSNYSLYDDIYLYMMESMEEGDLKNEITFQYGIMRGKAFLGQYRFKEALQVFESSFLMNPRNLELQTLILTALTYTFRNSSNQEIIRIVHEYSERFEEFNSNGMFISIQMLAYLSYAEELFDFNYGEVGLQYLIKFEELYAANPHLDIDYNQVGNSYSAAAVYYFKRYDKSQAKKFLERGLEIAPNNYELTYRLQSI